MKTAVTCLLAILWFFPETAARAEPRPADIPLRISVDTLPGCPGAGAFLAELQQQTPRAREAVESESARTMRIGLRAQDGQIVGVLTVRETGGSEGRREVRGADCESVIAGLAFVAAVIVDPAVAARSAGAVSSSRANGAAPLVPLASRQAAPRRLRLGAGAAIEATWGLGPDTVVIPRLFLQLEWALESPGLVRDIRLRVSGGRALARSIDTPLGTAHIDLTDVRFDPCFDLGASSRFRLGACGVVDAVVLAGAGKDTIQPQSAQRLSLELGAALQPGITLSDTLMLEAMVGAAAPLARYRFYFAPDTTAYRLAPWSVFAEFAVGIIF